MPCFSRVLDEDDVGFVVDILQRGVFDEQGEGFSFSDLIGGCVTVVFDEEMETCRLPDEGPVFDIRKKSNSPVRDGVCGGLSDVERLISLNQVYEAERDDEKGGWKTTVLSVEGLSGEKFRVRVETGMRFDIEWEFELSETTDPEVDEAARLIEFVGQGDPELMEGEDVYLVPKLDAEADSGLRDVGMDTQLEWVLVTPQDYESWEPLSECSDGDTDSDSSDIRRSSSEPSGVEDLAVPLFATGLVCTMFFPMLQDSSFDTTQAASGVEVLLIDTIVLIANAFGVLLLILGLILLGLKMVDS